jgi:predicted metal-dependent hydrolase
VIRDTLLLGRRVVPVTYVRNRRARHYLLRVEQDGSLRVTLPRGGSREEAVRFAKERAEWIEREAYKAAIERDEVYWREGSRVLLAGEDVPLDVLSENGVRMAVVGPHRFPVLPEQERDLRPLVESGLRQVASRELPSRLDELAAQHGFTPAGAAVRDQQSRWGSCSPSGHISLNWRLIQMPPRVRDYVLLHELTHLRQMDHSTRFWRELERVCPWHRDARAWLKVKGRKLLRTA